jgi:hypothetical protein
MKVCLYMLVRRRVSFSTFMSVRTSFKSWCGAGCCWNYRKFAPSRALPTRQLAAPAPSVRGALAAIRCLPIGPIIHLPPREPIAPAARPVAHRRGDWISPRRSGIGIGGKMHPSGPCEQVTISTPRWMAPRGLVPLAADGVRSSEWMQGERQMRPAHQLDAGGAQGALVIVR